MKQQKKFSNHAMPARRPRKTQGKCVLFADAAKLYIEYSKAVTSAETAVKRMRFFAQFYNASSTPTDLSATARRLSRVTLAGKTPPPRPREPARQPECRRCPHTLSAATRPARDRVRLRAARTRYVQNNTLLLDTMHTKWYAGPE